MPRIDQWFASLFRLLWSEYRLLRTQARTVHVGIAVVDQSLHVSVSNNGHVEVTLAEAGIRALKEGDRGLLAVFVMQSDVGPIRPGGAPVYATVPATRIHDELLNLGYSGRVAIHAFATLGTGRRFTSEAHDFDCSVDPTVEPPEFFKTAQRAIRRRFRSHG